jgi:hypothetical protein
VAWLSSGGGRLCGSNHPRAGVEAGPLRVKVAGQATDGVGYGTGLKDRGEAVGLRAQWGSSTAPASGRTPNASRSRRRRGESRQRMECGGLSPLCEASGVKAGLLTGCYHHRVEAGALGACDEGGRCARGKGGQEGWSICRRVYLQEHPQRRDDAEGIRVRFSGPPSFGFRLGRKLCWVWRPSGTTSSGLCSSRTAAPTRRPKTQMRRFGATMLMMWTPCLLITGQEQSGAPRPVGGECGAANPLSLSSAAGEAARPTAPCPHRRAGKCHLRHANPPPAPPPGRGSALGGRG